MEVFNDALYVFAGSKRHYFRNEKFLLTVYQAIGLKEIRGAFLINFAN
jgi:hypothetical protein